MLILALVEAALLIGLLCVLIFGVVIPIVRTLRRSAPHKITPQEIEEQIRIEELRRKLDREMQETSEAAEARLKVVFEEAHLRQKGSKPNVVQ